MSEEQVLKQIREGLCLCGAKVFRVHERIPWGKTKSEGGIPDLFGWLVCRRQLSMDDFTYGAVVFFIEVKKPGGRRRKAQEAFINQAHAAGIPACFAESFDDVTAEFERHGIKVKVK